MEVTSVPYNNHAVGNTIEAISHHEVRKRGKPLLMLTLGFYIT